VLADPQKKKIYDQFGEEGLKGGVPTGGEGGGGFPAGGGGGGGGGGGFRSGGTTFHFTPGNAEDIFAQFFGGMGGMGAGMGGMGGMGNMGGMGGMGGGGFQGFQQHAQHGGMDMDDEDYGGMGGMGGMYGGGGRRKPAGSRKQPPIKRKFACSLEELYTGTTKKMKITKTLMDESGKRVNAEKILNINVKPGWKTGTKITFPEEGDEAPGVVPADIIFVLEEKPHAYFVREADNLLYTANITLSQALTGVNIELPTLDGRRLKFAIRDVISPGYIKIASGEGMPLQKDPTRKGDLMIKFNIKFPASLTEEQRKKVKEALP
jgi:DnaJ family protein B protein 4